LSVNIGSLVGTLKVIDEASGVIGKVQAGIGGLTGVMSKMGGAMGDVGGIINSAFSGFATGGPAGAALGAGVTILGSVVTGIQSCVKEATASEAVWASLGAAVERAGGSWQTLKKGTEDALLAMSRVTTYSDEQLAQALEKLMTFGLSYDEAMKALSETIDFASAKHMDLESAATIVGKAMDGNTAILKRYGVDITTTKDATAALKDAHDAAKTAIEGMGQSVDAWVTSVTTAIGASAEFETGLAGAKDKAGYLIDQFQQGNIDLPQFTQAMQSLGVEVDSAKLKAGGAEEVLKQLNEQFGGAAQAQANTYAGVQERLKNATGEVSEKIGTMFLPTLASITEAFIPVVDGLGKGVDALGSWLTEVGKMPEVQGIITTVQGAFDGLWKGMQDFWGFLSETFGPVLQELGGALKEVFDALAPIGQAFGEVWAAITGGQEGGDWLKDLLKFVAQFIREVVVPAIKDAVPVIKGFADAFKAAADFALPILVTIKDAVVGFIDALKTTFYGFYTWLVGKSLWDDLWNGLGDIAQRAGTVIGGIVSGMFDVLNGIFKGGMDVVGIILTTGFSLAFATVQTIVTGATGVLSGLIGTIQDLIRGVTRDWGDLVTEISTSLDPMKRLITDFWTWTTAYWKASVNEIVTVSQVGFAQIQSIMRELQGTVSSSVSAMQGMFANLVASAQNAAAQVQSAMAQAQTSISNTTQGMVQTTQPAMNTFQNLFDQAASGVISAGKQLYDMLVGGSIWPDMFGTMQTITDTTMNAIQETVTSGFAATISSAQASLAQLQAIQRQAAAAMMAAPTVANVQATYAAQQAVQVAQTGVTSIAGAGAGGVFGGGWEPATPLNLTGGDLAAYAQKLGEAIFTATIGRSSAGGPATAEEVRQAQLNATLPISVVVDGVTVSRVVEQRMISQRQLAGGY